MNKTRTINPEILDSLPSDDPRAKRARRDLTRVNALMGNLNIWNRLFKSIFKAGHTPITIAELGAGDGKLLLRLARDWSMYWPKVEVTLVDLHPAVTKGTLESFSDLGWEVNIISADVKDWLVNTSPVDLIIANLFMHHFPDIQLSELFNKISKKTRVFACCEPRRSKISLLGSQLLALIGCGPVARYDAVVSVHAGFNGNELTALWPIDKEWQLNEDSAGLFTHRFIARITNNKQNP